MKINRSDLPQGTTANTSLDQQGSSKATTESKFAQSIATPEAQGTTGALSINTASTGAKRAALQHIANQINSADNDNSRAAVRESARYLIQSSLSENQRGTAAGARLIEDLSEHVAADPLLGNKLFTMLTNLKSN